MPIRLTCPSCSATLSVKDEYAGRAVKCPKCGGVIPAAQPAAPPPPPADASPPPSAAPAAAPAAFDDFDEPAKPAKTGGKITGTPVARSKGADADDDRPRRRGRDDDDDRGPAARRRDRDDDDRPAKRRRDEDDDGPPGRDKPKGKSSTGLVLGIIGGVLLLCCGGGVGVGYYIYTKAKETVEKVKENIEKSNFRVNQGNYNQIRVGASTRQQVDQTLGDGKIATADDLKAAFGADQKKIDAWGAKVADGRAVIWRNNDDFIVAAFHPGADAAGRLQAKEWRPKSGGHAADGELDDAKFVATYPPGKAGPALKAGTVIKAEDLAAEFKADPLAAERYTNKTFTVNGKLRDIEVVAGDLSVILEGMPGEGGTRVSCAIKKHQSGLAFNFARGQRLVIEGRCVGATAGSVSFNDCSITGAEKDPAEPVEAAALVAAYRTDTSGDAMFKGKQVRVRNAVIEKFGPDGIMIATLAGKKADGKKIRVEFDPEYRAITLTPPLRVGGSVTIRGLCEGVADGDIVITGAWFLH